MTILNGHTVDDARLPESPLVLDVGARSGGFVKAVLAIRPQARVVCIEPDPACEPPDACVTWIKQALVHDDRQAEGYASYSTGEGNYLECIPWFPVRDAKRLTVPCTNLPALMERLKIARWDLLKLDCEGVEFAVLESLTSPVADQITVEFHDFNTHKTIHNDAYYAALWQRLPWYHVIKHGLTPIGPGNTLGHWDSLLVLK